jgi:2-keto-3-deoxygluconate permease
VTAILAPLLTAAVAKRVQQRNSVVIPDPEIEPQKQEALR